MTEFNLNDHVHRLLMRETFLAALSRRVDKRVNKSIPTAGVRVNPDTAQFELSYNPEFFAKLTDAQRTGVLMHEFYHLVFEHVTGRLPDELAGVMKSQNPSRKERGLFRLWNVAADLSINCLIGAENLPDNCCIPGGEKFEDMPPGKTAEWYYEKLKQQKEEQQEGDGEAGEGEGEGEGEGDGPGQFDDHGGWGDVDEATAEMAKERLKEAMKGAATEAAEANSWGTVSQDVRRQILDRLTPKVDWRKVLRYFVRTSQRADKRSTVRRINKRFPYIHPGKKVRRTASIAVSIDQSGSVSDDMLTLFFSELNKLADVATFTVIPFDTRVADDKVYVWKKGENRKWERVMSGGTDFNPPTEYVNARSFDGHIVLTDMCAPKPKSSKCQRMWMTTKHYANNPYFSTTERVIAVD